MKIGILQTGETPEELRKKHGNYDDLFKRLLANRGFEFSTYKVLNGILPDRINAADGWLITGSRFGVYEGHNWIPPLEEFLRKSYAASVPIIGVCFGHQILAQALGGKVEKFHGGWSVGAVTYDFDNKSQNGTVMAWHQDQVTELPEGATVIGRSDFCKYAMLAYGDKALTIQPHPEFTTEFMGDLINARRDVLPKEIADGAIAGLGSKLVSLDIADKFEAFLKSNYRHCD